VGIKAAVHGVDPEAVKEAHHSKLMQCGPVFSAFIFLLVAAIICQSLWKLKLVSNHADTH
jgi:hypothetical protein